MRIAVISDIHGNCLALDAALNEIRAESVDMIVCLGDTVQGGAQPTETIDRLRGLAWPIVMGNADAWLLKDEADSVEPTSNEQREVRAWTLTKLSAEDTAFLRSYQPTVEIALGDSQRLLCFHGSPSSYDDVLLPDTPDEKWNQLLGPHSTAIMAGGHTHTQQMRRFGEGLFLNPGSIGLAYNYHIPEDSFHADPWAEFAILSFAKKLESLEFRRAHYDLDDLLRITRESGRPHVDKVVDQYTRGR